MARSKSPAPPRVRAAVKKQPPVADTKLAISELGDGPQLAIAVVVIASAYACVSNGSYSLASFGKSLDGGFQTEVPQAISGLWGFDCVFAKTFNFILVLHSLNAIAMSKTNGYWLNKFAQDFIAGSACVILPKILQGGNMIDAIFTDPAKDFTLSGFFCAWYIMNHDIPFCPVKFGLWEKVVDFGGVTLELLLDFATETHNTSMMMLVVTAQTPFTTEWFKTIAMGVMTGTATSFFPFNKGLKFSVSDEHTNALASSVFIASDGFKLVDFFLSKPLAVIGQADLSIGNCLNSYLCDTCGGVATFVLVVTAFNFLFGDVVSGIIGKDLKPGFDVFGVLQFVLGKCQLS